MDNKNMDFSNKTISLAIEKISDRMHELAGRSIELDIPYGSMYEGLEEAKKYYIGGAESYQVAKDTLAKRIEEFVDKSIDLDLPLRGSIYDGYKEAMNLLDAAQKEVREAEQAQGRPKTLTETLISQFTEKHKDAVSHEDACKRVISGTVKGDPYYSGTYGNLVCTFTLLQGKDMVKCLISDTENENPATKLFENGNEFNDGTPVKIEGSLAFDRIQDGQPSSAHINCTKVEVQDPVINKDCRIADEECL